MRYFPSFNAAYHWLLNRVDRSPEVQPTVRKIKTKEIMHTQFVLTNPKHAWVQSKTRNANIEYAKAFASHIIHNEPIDRVLELNPAAKRYVSTKHLPEGFSVSYAQRIHRQLPRIIQHLREDPESRRAVIHILEEGDKIILDHPNATMEYPCTAMLQFLIRDGHLHMFTMMRSQNVALTIIYDVYNFTQLQIYVAELLNYKLGYYHHYMVSAHFFDKEQEMVDDILDEHFGEQRDWQ